MMKTMNSGRVPISLFVIAAFGVMLCFWAFPAPAATTAPSAEEVTDAAAVPDEGEGTGFIESESTPPASGKRSKFPWLVAAALLVVGGAALYFLVLKKKNYELTVSVGEGVTGTPAAGTTTHKKGTVINYSYSLQTGYNNLAVTLDGVPVAASGTVTMNAGHILEAAATKTFVLTVTRGGHVDGTPSSGNYSHARGTNVSYSYAPAAGYSNLEVRLDNVPVSNSGTVAMDANHTLTALLRGANLTVESTPAGARIFLDDVDSGRTTPYTFNYSTAVTKTVLLQHSCGYKEYSQSVSIAVGETKTVSHAFVAGIKEDFEVPPSSCWLPYHASSWGDTGHGEYCYSGAASRWSTSTYNFPFSGNYTVIIRINRKSGSNSVPNGFFLGSGTDMTHASGYTFYYLSSPGQYAIVRTDNYNFITGSGVAFTIKGLTPSAAIKAGLGQYNVLKVVKTGSQYAFYINNTPLHTFSDATHAASFVALAMYSGGFSTLVEYEFVYLNPAT